MFRNPKDLIPDPNQPRKTFSEEEIENMSQTYKTHGIINPIEIDKNNMIITGEIRWRSAIKSGIKEIECTLLNGITTIERFERQVVENLHLHKLIDNEKEEAIAKLYKDGKEDGRYKNVSDFARKIGLKRISILYYIRANERRKKSKFLSNVDISTSMIDKTIQLPLQEQERVLKKVLEGKIHF